MDQKIFKIYLKSLVAGDDIGSSVFEFIKIEFSVAVHGENMPSTPGEIKTQGKSIEEGLERADVTSRLEPTQ